MSMLPFFKETNKKSAITYALLAVAYGTVAAVSASLSVVEVNLLKKESASKETVK